MLSVCNYFQQMPDKCSPLLPNFTLGKSDRNIEKKTNYISEMCGLLESSQSSLFIFFFIYLSKLIIFQKLLLNFFKHLLELNLRNKSMGMQVSFYTVFNVMEKMWNNLMVVQTTSHDIQNHDIINWVKVGIYFHINTLYVKQDSFALILCWINYVVVELIMSSSR